MNIVLLSGGSGKRLWPLSNDVRSKQFIKLFKNENGEYESMVQRMYRQIREVSADATITIATAKTQVSAIHNQLGEAVDICVEPARRDTFPAIVLASAYLHDVKDVELDETIIVCPVDPYVEADYFEALCKLDDVVKEDKAKLVLMGMEPTYPSEKYGYIIPMGKEEFSKVSEFKEKPDLQTAWQYLRSGALWNGGVFAFKLSYILDKAHELIEFKNYHDLLAKYETLDKISFDYAVSERETDIGVVRFSGEWKDLGTWNTLAEGMSEDRIGNVIYNETCENVHAVNELDIPILCMGLKDLVVSASPEGILVSDKEQSSYIKPYVDKIDQQIMFAEKSWGRYLVLDVEENGMTVKVTINAGHQMDYHSHERRDETWSIVSGRGSVVIDGAKRRVREGDVIDLPAFCKHTIIADTEMKVIEVQIGPEISVSDKIKWEM